MKTIPGTEMRRVSHPQTRCFDVMGHEVSKNPLIQSLFLGHSGSGSAIVSPHDHPYVNLPFTDPAHLTLYLP